MPILFMQLQTPHSSCPSSDLWDHTARQFGSSVHTTAAVRRLRQEVRGHVNEVDCLRRGDIDSYLVYPKIGGDILNMITKKLNTTFLSKQRILRRTPENLIATLTCCLIDVNVLLLCCRWICILFPFYYRCRPYPRSL